MEQFIAYYRVSTSRQGASGLGLEAQKSAVLSFLNNRPLIAAYTDIETGKNDNRPQLLKAIAQAQQTNSTLLIAKLDRLSRNLTFVSTLMDTKVKFICCDMPDANELTIHIFGALAQWERKRISDRTRSALQALKARGKRLGTPENFTAEARQQGRWPGGAKRGAFARAMRRAPGTPWQALSPGAQQPKRSAARVERELPVRCPFAAAT